MKVSLEDVLEARDRRQKKRRELALKYRLPVVVLTLNIPGETKRGEIPDYIFKAGVEAISRELLEETAEFSVVDAPTGNEAFFVARAADAAQLHKGLFDGALGLFNADIQKTHLFCFFVDYPTIFLFCG